MFRWLSRGPSAVAGPVSSESNASLQGRVTDVLYGLRGKVGQCVSHLTQLTGDEVMAATGMLQEVVDRSRAFVQDRQHSLAKMESHGTEAVGLLGAQASMLDEVRK